MRSMDEMGMVIAHIDTTLFIDQTNLKFPQGVCTAVRVSAGRFGTVLYQCCVDIGGGKRGDRGCLGGEKGEGRIMHKE